MNWRHFIHRNKKLTKLKDLKRQIYKELDLDSELLLVYGNKNDQNELKRLIKSQKQKYILKSTHILDSEEFELKF